MDRIYILGGGLFGFLKNEELNKEHINIYLHKLLINLRRNDILFEDNKYDIETL